MILPPYMRRSKSIETLLSEVDQRIYRGIFQHLPRLGGIGRFDNHKTGGLQALGDRRTVGCIFFHE